MKRYVKPEDYSRDWARGVCMSVERMTGSQPRARRIWPTIVSWLTWLGVLAGIAVLAAVNGGVK